ncbi:hypothetical protein OUZ56_017128 [Daphnia magna]|uniref:Uncharacterized protein n=1 Tax=Daphnia magna TaxID=35525 RepID=A0ABR0AS75_9CRUS|nr:hypothetical protein OUZ56_017128 [Daphnia magna]
MPARELPSSHGSDSDQIDETPRLAIDSLIPAASPRHPSSQNHLLEQHEEQSITPLPNLSSLNERSVVYRPESPPSSTSTPERSVVYRPESPVSSTSDRSVVCRPESSPHYFFSSTPERSVVYRPESPRPLLSLIRPAQQYSAVQLPELLASLTPTPTHEKTPEKKSLERQAREVSRSMSSAIRHRKTKRRETAFY